MDDEKDKIGVSLKINCLHPMLNKEIRVYVANFVLDNYGEGAIFSCLPWRRDFEFAKKYDLPIIKLLIVEMKIFPIPGDGKIINSEFLNGLSKDAAING